MLAVGWLVGWLALVCLTGHRHQHGHHGRHYHGYIKSTLTVRQLVFTTYLPVCLSIPSIYLSELFTHTTGPFVYLLAN